MAASSAPAAGYPVPFFEGAEKKVEIRFAVPADNARGMRALPVSTWATALGRGGVEIISSMSSSGWDSYVLSESSLFVSRTRVVCKTCGQSAPLYVLEDILASCASVGCAVRAVLFSRSNLLDAPSQRPVHRSFAAERAFLDELLQLTGQFYIFGDVSSTHWNLYTATLPLPPALAAAERGPTPTLELAMYGLDQPAAQARWWKHSLPDAATCRRRSGLARMLPGADMQWDDCVFEPCGYSMNALDGAGHYYTVHVTPQPGCSFASFETDATADPARTKALITAALQIFKPDRISISLLDAEGAAAELPPLDDRFDLVRGSDCMQRLTIGRHSAAAERGGSHHFQSFSLLETRAATGESHPQPELRLRHPAPPALGGRRFGFEGATATVLAAKL